MKSTKSSANIENINEAEIIKMEQDFLDRYYSAGNKKPLPIILRMCRGYYDKLILSAVFCVLQLSAVLFIPIATANIIDALTSGGSDILKTVMLNFGIAAFLLAINYPMQQFYRKIARSHYYQTSAPYYPV